MLTKMVLRVWRISRNAKQLCLLIAIAIFSIFSICMISVTPDRYSVTSLNVFSWFSQQSTSCGRNYTGYANRFFKIRSAVYHPDVDAFSIICKSEMLPPRYWFLGKFAPEKYTKSLMQTPFKHYNHDMSYKKGITIAIHREYPHNFYHAMTQWYNVYVLSRLFKFDIENVNILLLDRSTPTHIDRQWSYHFKEVIRAENLTTPVQFENIIFNIPGHESPMYYFDIDRLPFIEEFSERFLHTFGMKNNKKLDCNNLTVILYVRHDYYFHPGIDTTKRNVERKLKNEQELISVLKDEFKNHSVRTLMSEDMSLEHQLRLAVTADVLIGMHGCGLTHTLFLPKHATVFELFPITWEIKKFFSSFAKWRNITHEYWRNQDEALHFEKEHFTHIPETVFRDYAKRAKTYLGCLL